MQGPGILQGRLLIVLAMAGLVLMFRSAGRGGSWVVTTMVISRVTILITHISGLITPLITTHDLGQGVV